MNVGLLGAGHIAQALAEGWTLPEERTGRPERLVIFDIVSERAAALAARTGGSAAADVAGLVDASDAVIVAVRPPQVPGVLDQLAPLLGERSLISVAAGVPLARLQERLPPGARVSRVMPNVAAALGRGVFLFVPGSLGAATAAIDELFASAGTVVEVEERLFDVATAVAGCMPGYMARLVQAFAAAGVAGGLDGDVARTLATAAAHGAAAVVAAEGDPAAVVTAAATPGGMTAAGIEALEAHDIETAVAAAVRAAATKARELA